MNNLHKINFVFTVVILVLGVVMFIDYQEYKPDIKTTEDVVNVAKEVEKYTDIGQLKERYIDHVRKNFTNHRVIDTLIEYVIYLFGAVAVLLVLTVVAVYKMEQR